MRIACGFDHAGVPLRDAVVAALEQDGHALLDVGTYEDYPYAAAAVARALADGAERGVLGRLQWEIALDAERAPTTKKRSLVDLDVAAVWHGECVRAERRHDCGFDEHRFDVSMFRAKNEQPTVEGSSVAPRSG